MKKNLCIKNLKNNDKSQIIALMGILLVISVFAISSIATDLANIDIDLSSETSISLLKEYNFVKDAFPRSLTYNLADDVDEINDKVLFYGDISNLDTVVFDETVDEFYQMELEHDIFFNAELNKYYIAHPGSSDGVYHLEVTLTLKNRNTEFVEDVIYSIMCIPYYV